MDPIGRYQILELLGQGGLGRVYLGFDPKLQREVAVKVLHEHITGDDAQRRLFHREARAAARLDHPNVVKVFDYSGPEEQVQYIVMQRLRGVDLGTLLDQLVRIPETLVVAIAYEICLALEHIHGNGLLHRDIKPENLFLEPDGRVVVGDFGIAKASDDQALGATMIVEHSQVMGTPLYMAPELVRAGLSSPASDLYALGAVMFHLLAGVPAYSGHGTELLERIVAGQTRFLREHDPSLSSELAAVVHTMMSADVKARPDSASIHRQLRSLLDRDGVTDTRLLLQRFFGEPELTAEQYHRAQAEKARAGAPSGHSGVHDSTNTFAAPLVQSFVAPTPGWRAVPGLLLALALGIGTGLLALWVTR